MTKKQQLVEALCALASENDVEERHMKADELLLRYIGDAEVARAFHSFEKWYA